MKSTEFLVTLADTEVAFRFHLSGTGMLFRGYEKKTVPEDYGGPWLQADPEMIRACMEENRCGPEEAEFICLMTEAADCLAKRGRAMFHGAAFICGSGAWILTAPSGTGKSTQYRNLRSLYGDRVRIINGDKPLLCPSPDGGIRVFPSPWNGKENWGGKESAPLRGVVFLEQGGENVIRPLTGQEAAVPLIEQFIYTARTRKSVHTVFALADAVAKRIPLYHLVNRGDAASSEMLYNLIRRVGPV